MMYSVLFEDEDDIFTGSPRSKFMDIVYNANRGLVEQELERLMTRQAALELMLGEHHGEALEQKIREFEFNNAEEVSNVVKSLYMESVGNVVTNNE